MQKSATRSLATFAAKVKFEDLPGEVVQQTKLVILDTLACALGGYTTPMSKLSAELVKDLGGKPESTVIAAGIKSSCANAAFVNANSGNALDLDETFCNTAHPANAIMMSPLALAERVHASGKELVMAVALGYDIAARVISSLGTVIQLKGKPPHLKAEVPPGSRPTISWHVFGATAASGRIIGLDAEGIANAFGIGGYHTVLPFSTKFLVTPPIPMTKYGCTGWVAQLAVVSALLAQKGFTGDTSVLDGDYGYWAMTGAPGCDWDALTAGLGEKWWITESQIKPYPACRWTNSALDLLYKILREHKVKPDDIDSIVVRVHPGAVTPVFLSTDLKTAQGAEFSIPYLMSVAAHGIEPTSWYLPETMRNPGLLSFAGKVKVETEPRTFETMYEEMGEGSKLFKRAPTTVVVKARGQTFTEYREYTPGDPWQPQTRMTESQMVQKFRTWASLVLPPAKVDKATELILGLDKVKDVTDMTSLL